MRKCKKRDVDFRTLQFICSLTEALRPREELSITEWAEKNMILPDGGNESGHFRVSNMPFQKEIMDVITDPRVTNVVIMSSAQVGKTTIVLCGIGYYIDHEPAVQMVVLPTLQTGERFSKTMLAKMIRNVKVLAEKITTGKAKDSDNTILFKQYAGGHVVVGGANSPASLAMLPIRVVWMDEIDRFPDSAGEEGNPIKLAEKRATSFWNKKFIKTSTPTIAGRSKVEAEYNKGTMEEWCVQCPCCGTWQPYDFHQIVFDSISMTCVECGEDIPERDWKESNHKWIAAHPERRSFRSFHLNELCSPFVAWKKIIDDFKEAYDKMKRLHDPTDFITFINTTLGETWDETAWNKNKTNAKEVQERAEYYSAELPDGVILLTAAVDVQDNRFEVEIRGWAREYETWGIYKTEIYGDLTRKEVWGELEEYIGQTFTFANGMGLGVAATTIDTGGSHTNEVYKWLRKMKVLKKRVYGIKGYAQKKGIPLIYDKNSKGNIKEVVNGKEVVVDKVDLVTLGVDAGKEDIQNRLSIKEPGSGYCHFPSNGGRGYDDIYYKGLFAESKIKKKVRGVIKDVWIQKSGVRNEPLDLFVYGYAACELLRVRWGVLEAKIKKGIDYTKKRKSQAARRNVRRSQKGEEW